MRKKRVKKARTLLKSTLSARTPKSRNPEYMKWVVGLGNPGAEYDESRHNVGWWMADRLAYDWGLDSFRRRGSTLIAEGTVADEDVSVLKPLTFMNRSGGAIASALAANEIEVERDLLVIVDDAMIDVGKVRLRGSGSAGGHNGLRSIERTLGSRDYARLRIGVGRAPQGADLADWVLSAMPKDDEDVVVGLLPELTPAVELWMKEGIEAAKSRFNR
jgi:PTH1 family peptidyl-tRNA hydrolase